MASLLSRMKIRYGKFMAVVSLFTLLSFPVAGIAQNLGKVASDWAGGARTTGNPG